MVLLVLGFGEQGDAVGSYRVVQLFQLIQLLLELCHHLLPLRGELLLEGFDLLEGAVAQLLGGGVCGELQVGAALL